MPRSNKKLQRYLKDLKQQAKAAIKQGNTTTAWKDEIASVRREMWNNKGKRWQRYNPSPPVPGSRRYRRRW